MNLETLYEQIKEFGYRLESYKHSELYRMDNHITVEICRDSQDTIIQIKFYK